MNIPQKERGFVIGLVDPLKKRAPSLRIRVRSHEEAFAALHDLHRNPAENDLVPFLTMGFALPGEFTNQYARSAQQEPIEAEGKSLNKLSNWELIHALETLANLKLADESWSLPYLQQAMVDAMNDHGLGLTQATALQPDAQGGYFYQGQHVCHRAQTRGSRDATQDPDRQSAGTPWRALAQRILQFRTGLHVIPGAVLAGAKLGAYTAGASNTLIGIFRSSGEASAAAEEWSMSHPMAAGKSGWTTYCTPITVEVNQVTTLEKWREHQMLVRQIHILRSGTGHEASLFAKNNPKADLKALEARVLAVGTGQDAYRFAKCIPGADREALEALVLANQDDRAMFLFAREIPGANVHRLQERVLQVGSAQIAYLFACEIEDADVCALHARATAMGMNLDDPWQIKHFNNLLNKQREIASSCDHPSTENHPSP